MDQTQTPQDCDVEIRAAYVPTDQELIQSRGNIMVKTINTKITPVKHKINPPKITIEINVCHHIKQLFDLIENEDPYLILQSSIDNTNWARSSDLPLNEDFHEHFTLREENFIRIVRTIVIHTKMMSKHPIKIIKFSNPVYQFLSRNNMYLKVDYFKTEKPSSSGYYTIIHPHITWKMDFINES